MFAGSVLAMMRCVPLGSSPPLWFTQGCQAESFLTAVPWPGLYARGMENEALVYILQNVFHSNQRAWLEWLELIQQTSAAFSPTARAEKRFCVSSLRRGHANLLCIVPILVYVLPKQVQTVMQRKQYKRLGTVARSH